MYDRYLIMPREMSWLSPKRRRTTGTVATLATANANATANATINGQENGSAPSSPRVRSPSSSLSRVPMTPKSDPPPLRPAFQQTASSAQMPSAMADGNLFYAYARKADDVRSRYLLTFASASIANEWWSLLQTHFVECTRPGPQLFSFKTDDLLGRAWKHADFAHLKSKWMYIQFNDAGNVGGAAQGIIPVQDAQGHLLGGSAGNSPDSQLGQVRKEARIVRNELGTLESHFERMMEAVEKNTEQIAALAEERKGNDQALVQAVKENGVTTNGTHGHFDMSELSGHLGRISDLLERNQEHVEALSKRQHDSEQRLRDALEENRAQKRADYLDMSQLSTHLDRIQKLMERNVHERKDSAKDLRNTPPSLDISPLTERLEKVLGAVEHNSSLVKDLLDDGAKNREVQREQKPPSLDLGPMTEHLEKIHGAIEQQSSHMQALVGFAGGDGGGEDKQDEQDSGGDGRRASFPHAVSLAPLSEHLEQIFTAIEEGNTHVRTLVTETTKNATSAGKQKVDFKPLERKLDELVKVQKDTAGSRQEVSFDPVVERLDSLLEAQKDAANGRSDTVDIGPLTKRLDELLKVSKLSSSAKQQQLDLRPLSTRLDKLLEAHQNASGSHELDLSPLAQRLDDLLDAQHSASERQQDVDAQLASKFDKLVEGQQKSVERGPFDISLLSQRLDEILSVHRAAATTALLEKLDALKEVQEKAADKGGVDLGPLAVHLKGIRAATERNEKRLGSLIEAQQAGARPATDLGPLLKSMDSIRSATERNAELLGSLLDAQQAGNEAIRPSTDLASLAEHLDEIRDATDKNSEHLAGLVKAQEASNKAEKPTTDLGPLVEHLDAIRKAAERDSLSRHLEKQQAEPMNEHLQAIREATAETGQHMSQLLNFYATNSNQQPPPIDLGPFLENLEALRSVTEENGAQLTEFLHSQSSDNKALAPSSQVDFTPLTDRLTRIHSSLEQQADQRRSESPGLGDIKFIMSALTSHLSKIQAVTEANANAVRALREKQDTSGNKVHMAMSEANDQLRTMKESHTASQKAMQNAIATTSESVRALAKQTAEFTKQSVADAKTATEQRKKEKKDSDGLAGVRDGQVNQVLRAQGEMVESVRDLAKAIKMEKKECGHVVVPPPRKTGRKVVGFVYEGGAAGTGGGGPAGKQKA